MWTENEERFLKAQRIGRLATIGRSGPELRPVGFTLHGDTIDIGGAQLSRTQKWRNIQSDDRVAFCVDDLGADAAFAPRGVEIRGHAQAISGDEELICIHPIKIISWGLDSSPFAAINRIVKR